MVWPKFIGGYKVWPSQVNKPHAYYVQAVGKEEKTPYVLTLDPAWKGARCSCPWGIQKAKHTGVPCKHQKLVENLLSSINYTPGIMPDFLPGDKLSPNLPASGGLILDGKKIPASYLHTSTGYSQPPLDPKDKQELEEILAEANHQKITPSLEECMELAIKKSKIETVKHEVKLENHSANPALDKYGFSEIAHG